MSRMIYLCLAAGVVAQVLPQGCPLFTGGGGSVRGTIATTATGPAEAGYGETVTLSATATADVDGGAIAYQWAQVAGAGVKVSDAGTATASFAAPSLPSDQALGFVVVASNERGDIGRAEVNVLVRADPEYGSHGTGTAGLVARAGPDRTVPANQAVTLDGSASRGDGLQYAWSQVSGASVALHGGTTARATFLAPAFDPSGANTLEFELEVTDSRGRRASDRVLITIRAQTPSDETDPKPRVRIRTSMGNFTVELDRTKAPLSTNNFLEYVTDQFYEGLIFHRVIKDFVVQGGGYTPDLIERITREPIANESDNGLKNLRATIAMARQTDPDSATSQFYINLVDNASLDGQPGQPGYAVFGKVVDGMSVVDAIGAVPVETREGFANIPVEDVIILGIDRLPGSSDNQRPDGTINPGG